MKILPAKTDLPDEPFPTDHDPPDRLRFPKFRSCLRWEFGFVCALCLTHEKDLFEHGSEGTALTWIEHFHPKHDGARPDLEDHYPNCLYSCRFCNSSRGTKPVDPPDREGRLLNPREDAWEEHFEWEDDEIVAKSGDADAEYTEKAYDLNEPRKVQMRESRREFLEDRREVLEECSGKADRLLKAAASEDVPVDGRQDMIDAANELMKRARKARDELERFAAIPGDAPAECKCDPEPVFELPDILCRQCWSGGRGQHK